MRLSEPTYLGKEGPEMDVDVVTCHIWCIVFTTGCRENCDLCLRRHYHATLLTPSQDSPDSHLKREVRRSRVGAFTAQIVRSSAYMIPSTEGIPFSC